MKARSRLCGLTFVTSITCITSITGHAALATLARCTTLMIHLRAGAPGVRMVLPDSG
jgi:hypothetical protein